MLSTLVFEEDHRCFTKGQRFEFRPGVNPIVGDQGTGKSTLLVLVARLATPDPWGGAFGPKKEHTIRVTTTRQVALAHFDFEKDNPRTKSYFEDKGGMFQVVSHFLSHGETTMALVEDLDKSDYSQPTTMLLDEPDTGLSPRSAHTLLKLFQKLGKCENLQLLVTLHNPILIAGFEEVLSLEHGGWVSSQKFMADQVDPQIKAPWRVRQAEEAKKPARQPKLSGIEPLGPSRRRKKRSDS